LVDFEEDGVEVVHGWGEVKGWKLEEKVRSERLEWELGI